MSRCGYRLNTPSRGSFCFLLTLFICVFTVSYANPLPQALDSQPELRENTQPTVTVTTIEPDGNSTNSTINDLYVIKAVIYEIGILTDVDNSTDETTDRHEEVNLSFYDPPHTDNGLLDLSGIPIPQIASLNPTATDATKILGLVGTTSEDDSNEDDDNS